MLPEGKFAFLYIRVVNQTKKTHLYPTRYMKHLNKFYLIILDTGGKKKDELVLFKIRKVLVQHITPQHSGFQHRKHKTFHDTNTATMRI